MLFRSIMPFETVQKELWIQFADMETYKEQEEKLYHALLESEGEDAVIIYINKEKKKKVLSSSRNVRINPELLNRLYEKFGEKNVKAVEKRIENVVKMN